MVKINEKAPAISLRDQNWQICTLLRCSGRERWM